MPPPAADAWTPPEVVPDWQPPEASAAVAPPAAAAPPPPTYPTGSFWHNFAGGFPMGAEKLGSGLAQRFAGATNPETGEAHPEATPDVNAEAARVRQYYGPLSKTWGGTLGEGAMYSLPAMIPGLNTVGGAAALGTAVGAAQPTVGDESWKKNALISGLLSMVGQGVGNKIGSWATARAAQPITGFSRAAGDRTLAASVGSDADRLTPEAAQAAADRLEGIYKAVRSPKVDVPLDANTEQAAYNAALGKIENQSSGVTFENNKAVTDYLGHATVTPGKVGKPPTAAQLGDISTRLRQQAHAIFNSDRGDYDLGHAYDALRSHIDDLIAGSITDPKLAAQYAAARPQYARWKMIEDNPALYKAATGEANMPAIGNYLQRNNSELFRTSQDPLFQIARWGQATGGGKPAEGLKERLLQGLVNNPATRSVGGLSSRYALAPAAPALGAAGQGAAYQALPLINALRGTSASQWIPPALAAPAAGQ